jgi:hypothetical protein
MWPAKLRGQRLRRGGGRKIPDPSVRNRHDLTAGQLEALELLAP